MFKGVALLRIFHLALGINQLQIPPCIFSFPPRPVIKEEDERETNLKDSPYVFCNQSLFQSTFVIPGQPLSRTCASFLDSSEKTTLFSQAYYFAWIKLHCLSFLFFYSIKVESLLRVSNFFKAVFLFCGRFNWKFGGIIINHWFTV